MHVIRIAMMYPFVGCYLTALDFVPFDKKNDSLQASVVSQIEGVSEDRPSP